MTNEPDIVKQLRQAEKFGMFHDQSKSNYEETQMPDIPLDKTFHETSWMVEDDLKNTRKNIELLGIKEKYFKIFENCAVAITLADNKEYIVSWNKYTEELLNMNEKDLFMSPVSSLYPSEEWKKIRAENIRQKGIKYTTESKMIRKNQGTIDVELSLSVLKSAEEKIVGSIGIIKDITKLKKIEKELIVSEQRYRTIFENSAIAIMLSDENEQIISWNKFTEVLLGMGKEDLNLKPVESLYPPEEWKKIRAENIRQKGLQHHLETKMFKKNNVTIDVNLSISVLKNHEGKVVGSIGVIRDITERKKAEGKLREKMCELDKAHKLLRTMNEELEIKVKERTGQVEQLLEQKDAFINQLGHDLKTPLTPLMILLPMLKECVYDAESKVIIDSVLRNIDKIRNLVLKTLQLAKLSSSKVEFDIHDLNLLSEVNEIIGNNQYFFEEKDVKVENMIDNKIIVKADKLQLNEIFTNIFTNAVKYSLNSKDCRIIINAQTEKNGDVIISVKDNGIGIMEEEINHIFDEFYKIDSSRHDLDSSGLGLSICKRIVEKHGGKIWAESPGSDMGSTFYFTLKAGEK